MPELSQFEKDDVVYDLKDTFAREELENKLPASWAEWRVIADVTLESEVGEVRFDNDIAGEPFTLHEIVAFIKMLPNKEQKTSLYIRLFANDRNIFQPQAGVPSSGYRWVQVYTSLVGDAWAGINALTSVNTATNFADGYWGSIADINSGELCKHAPATSVRVSFLTDVGVGSKIIILGR